MAIAVIQSTGGTRAGSGANYALAFPGNVVAGNRLVVTVARWQGGGGTGTLTDSQGNTYTRHVGMSTAGHEVTSIWSAIAGSSAACTVTFTPPVATFIGLGLTEVFDATSVGSTGSTGLDLAFLPGPSNLSIAHEAIVFGMARGTAGATITPQPGWTQIYEDETFTNVPSTHVYRIETDYAGPMSPAWTTSIGNWTCTSVAFESTTALTGTPTKIYLGNITAPYTPATLRGSWSSTGFAVTKGLTLNAAAGGASTTISVGETSATSPFDVLMYRGVLEGLDGQIVSGTVQTFVSVYESAVAADFSWHLHLYVTQGDSDTPRGTLLSDYTDGVGVEWYAGATLAEVRGLTAPQTLSTLGVAAGDHLVAELGYRSRNTSTLNMTGTLRYGSATAGVALPDAALWTNNITHAMFLLFSDTITVGGRSPSRVFVTVSP